MRLDLFLKVSRLVPRRSLAQKFCDAGLISVNGSVAKASKELKVEDEVQINRRDRTTKVCVKQIPDTKNVAKNAAGRLYEMIEDVRVEDDGLV